jgi:pimeloyl-ACP methyl ester carboxylesterase
MATAAVTDETIMAPPARRLTLRQRVMRRIVCYLLLPYSLYCTGVFLYQDWLLFPADMAGTPLPLGYPTLKTIVLTRSVPDVGDVIAWFMPSPQAAAGQAMPVVMFFHGNAELIDSQLDSIEGYHRLGCSVLLPEFRGYGKSAGHPSEAAILDDAAYFFDLLVKRPDVDTTRIVMHGRSVGGGPASILATRRPVKALILQSTFKSAASMAMRYGAPSFLVSSPFHVDDAVATLEIPMLIFHGTHDDIIPVSHGRALADLARNATYMEFDCNHNSFPGDENVTAYWDAVASFLQSAGVIMDRPR